MCLPTVPLPCFIRECCHLTFSAKTNYIRVCFLRLSLCYHEEGRRRSSQQPDVEALKRGKQHNVKSAMKKIQEASLDGKLVKWCHLEHLKNTTQTLHSAVEIWSLELSKCSGTDHWLVKYECLHNRPYSKPSPVNPVRVSATSVPLEVLQLPLSSVTRSPSGHCQYPPSLRGCMLVSLRCPFVQGWSSCLTVSPADMAIITVRAKTKKKNNLKSPCSHSLIFLFCSVGENWTVVLFAWENDQLQG